MSRAKDFLTRSSLLFRKKQVQEAMMDVHVPMIEDMSCVVEARNGIWVRMN